ncbi:MAG: DUF3667 domain-containing protein [Chthoniobacterales bacterium]
MSEETTEFILGDAAIDATSEGRRGRRRRKRREHERTLTHCENCGATLSGPYCAQCGQHAIDYRRSLWRVLIDAADSFLNWDTKFLSTIWILLTRPWRLTNDFNAGRRASYVHPLRLYLLASIAFFLMIKFVPLKAEGPLELRPEDRAQISATLAKLTGPDSALPSDQQAKIDALRARITEKNGTINAEERAELKQIINSAVADKMRTAMKREDRAKLKAALARIPKAPPPSPPPAEGEAQPTGPAIAPPVVPAAPPIDVQIGDDSKPKSPFELWLQKRVKDKVGGDGSKTKLFLETLRNNIPTMMLCCIPLFALVLKILYVRRGRYYVEHLVYALHIHSFVYVGVLVITLIGLALGEWSQTARALVAFILSITMLVQVFLSIRRVYPQSWFFSVVKFLVGGFTYLIILVLAVGITALVTILLPA